MPTTHFCGLNFRLSCFFILDFLLVEYPYLKNRWWFLVSLCRNIYNKVT